MRPRILYYALPITAVVTALACQKPERAADTSTASTASLNQSDTFADQAKVAPVAPPAPPSAPGGFMAARESAARLGAARDEGQTLAASGQGGAVDPSRAGRNDVTDPAQRAVPDMIIRMGQASVEVDSLDVAVARVRQLASRVGGVIANSSLQSGRNQVRSATIEIRVAAPRYDELVAGLTPFGKVESVNVTAEDVGEEYVDLSARVANARRLEERLIELLARRTGKLADVLTVERELARVREEIERYEGRLRYLRARSAVSTLAVTVHEPLPVLAGQPATNPIAQAFVQAWRLFVGLVAALITSLGLLVPAAAVAGLGWLVWRRVRRQPVVEAKQTA